MDETRARLMPHSAHTREDREIAYRAIEFAAELLLRVGASAVLDAPYGYPEDRSALGRQPLLLVECKVSPEVAAERFRSRDLRHPGMQDLDEARVREIVRTFPYTGKGLLIDTGALGVEECVTRIRRYVASGRPLAPGEWTS